MTGGAAPKDDSNEPASLGPAELSPL